MRGTLIKKSTLDFRFQIDESKYCEYLGLRLNLDQKISQIQISAATQQQLINTQPGYTLVHNYCVY